MAKLVLEVDTMTNEGSALVDGKPFENLCSVYMDCYKNDRGEPEYHFEIRGFSKEEGNITKIVTLFASENQTNKLRSDIAKFFGAK